MMQTHRDRVAERDPSLCCAYGCPLMGTMTRSTSGANDWCCAFHASRSAGQMQMITMTINRYRWLAEAITQIRGMTPGRSDRAQLVERIRNDFHQRLHPELCWNQAETVRQWVNRLEKALDELLEPDLQTLATPEAALPKDTWQSAGTSLPLWA